MSPALAHRSTQQNLVISNMTDGMVTIALALLSNPPLQPSTPSCPVPDKSFPHTQEESVDPSSSAATYQSTTNEKKNEDIIMKLKKVNIDGQIPSIENEIIPIVFISDIIATSKSKECSDIISVSKNEEHPDDVAVPFTVPPPLHRQ